MPVTAQAILDDINQQIESRQYADRFSQMSAEEFRREACLLQAELAQKYNIDTAQIRAINLSMVEDLASSIKMGANKQLFFRHGEQAKQEGADNSKIAMMSLPRNQTDPITPLSAIEFISTQLTLLYLQAQTNAECLVEYSANMRAKQPGLALKQCLKAEGCESELLACVNYPEINDKNKVHLQADGGLDWDKQRVNALLGENTFEKMVETMRSLSERTKLRVLVTHTQQHQALGTAKGVEVPRLSNYGFLMYDRDSDTLKIYNNGVYYEKYSLKDMLLITDKKRMATAQYELELRQNPVQSRLGDVSDKNRWILPILENPKKSMSI